MASLRETIEQIKALPAPLQPAARQQAIAALGYASNADGQLYSKAIGQDGEEYNRLLNPDDVSAEEMAFLRGTGAWQTGYSGALDAQGRMWNQNVKLGSSVQDPNGGYWTPWADMQAWGRQQGSNPFNDFLVNYGPALTALAGGGIAGLGGGAGAAGAEGLGAAGMGGTTLGAIPGVGPTVAAADISALSQPFLGTGLGAGGYGSALTPAFGTTGLEAAAAGGLGATAAGNAYSPTGLSVLDNPTLGTGLGSTGAAAATPSVVQAGGVTMPSVGAGAATSAAAATPGLWERVMGGTATADDWARVLGTGATVGLGMAQGNQMADAIQNVGNQQNAVAQQFMGLGAPYRDLLAQSYQPGFDLFSQPGYSDALSKTADISTRAWSGRGVNPANNPGAQAEIQRDVLGSAYLPALNSYRGGLGQFGGLGLNTSGSLFGNAGNIGLAGASAQGQGLGALGFGIGNLTNQQPSIADLLKQMPQYKNTIGGLPT